MGYNYSSTLEYYNEPMDDVDVDGNDEKDHWDKWKVNTANKSTKKYENLKLFMMRMDNKHRIISTVNFDCHSRIFFCILNCKMSSCADGHDSTGIHPLF